MADSEGPTKPKHMKLEQPTNKVLSDYTEFNLNESVNVGKFAVVAVHLFPLGTFKEQNEDRVELILSDKHNKWILFSGEGEHYLKCENIKAGEVIQVKDFLWKEVAAHNQKYIIMGVNYEKKGVLQENSDITVLPLMQHLGVKYNVDKNTVFSLAECTRNYTKFSARLTSFKMNKTASCGDVLSLLFETSDHKRVQLGFFGDQAQTEWNLSPGKMYQVLFAKSDTTNTRYADVSLFGTPRTEIMELKEKMTSDKEIARIEEIAVDTGTTFIGDFFFRDVIKTSAAIRATALDGTLDDNGLASAVLVEAPLDMALNNHAALRIKFHAVQKGHTKMIHVLPGYLQTSAKAFDAQLAKHRLSFK